MLQIWADEVFSIGTVAGVLQPVVVNAKLRNVPEQGIYNWDPGAYFGIYKPDGFWFEQSEASAKSASADYPAGDASVGSRREMLSYLVHRILIMIPTLIAISIVIFTIINLPPGDYFSTYIAELQSSGEAADLAKINFLKAQYGFDRPALGAIPILGRRSSARRHGLFLRL